MKTIENGKKYLKYSSLVRYRYLGIEPMGYKKYRTKQDIIYYIDYNNKNEYIIVPKGYIFDFNSSPCYTECIVGREEFMIALIHDWLYSKNGEIVVKDSINLSDKFYRLHKYGYGYSIEYGEETKKTFIYSRELADIIWLEGAKEEAKNIEKINKDKKAYIGYLGIRIKGGLYFKK